jgi:hypothetical protein
MTAKKQKHTFAAKMRRNPGAWVTVEIPAAISKAIGIRGSIPIVGVVNGKEKFRSSLLPTGRGVHLLPIKYEARKNLGLGPGDRITVTFEIDREPRTIATPPDVIDALESEGLLDAYELIPPGRKMQFLKYLEQAVHEETRLKRIAMMVEMAHAAREKQVDREMQRKLRQTRT